MRRYYREMDGSMDPADDGEWVRWEDAEAEAARLRAAFVDAENELDAKHAKLVEVADKLATERAAHEATKESLMQSRAEVGGLKARVAELDDALGWEKRERQVEIALRCDAERALSSARGLLEMWMSSRRADRVTPTRAWLRDHPEPATPACCESCGNGHTCTCEDEPATPAATGAERCKRCGLLQSEYGLQRVETPDPFESVEKEQGT